MVDLYTGIFLRFIALAFTSSSPIHVAILLALLIGLRVNSYILSQHLSFFSILVFFSEDVPT